MGGGYKLTVGDSSIDSIQEPYLSHSGEGSKIPFEHMPHILLTSRYSGSRLPNTEMYNRHVYLAEHVSTREPV